MIVVPIVFTRMVIGIAGVGDGKSLERIGLKALVYFEIITTILDDASVLLAGYTLPAGTIQGLGRTPSSQQRQSPRQ